MITAASRVARMTVVGVATTWSAILTTLESSFTIVICLLKTPKLSKIRIALRFDQKFGNLKIRLNCSFREAAVTLKFFTNCCLMKTI